MNKILLALGLLILSITAIGQISLQERYSNNSGFYTRFYGEKNLYKKFGFIAGYNMRGRGISNLEGTYEVRPGVKIVAGSAYHPYQDGFHPSFGIAVNTAYKEAEIIGHFEILLDHLYYIDSEWEISEEISEKVSMGVMCEAEVGKEFMSLKEAKEFYIPKKPIYETVLLLGPMASYKITERFSAMAFVTFGIQNKENENLFSSKTGIGVSYAFKKHH